MAGDGLTTDDIRRYYRRYYRRPGDEAHGWPHIERVRAEMRRLVEAEGYDDPALADAAAVLHDIGNKKDRKTHEIVGAALAMRDRRLRRRFDAGRLAKLVDAVRQHRASSGKPETTLARMLSDADRLSSFGHPGESLLRAYRYGKTHRAHMSEDDQILEAARHQVEKYGPSGYGRAATHFPASKARIDEMMRAVTPAYEKRDVAALKRLIDQAAAKEG
jgi:uncharacterized protein